MFDELREGRYEPQLEKRRYWEERIRVYKSLPFINFLQRLPGEDFGKNPQFNGSDSRQLEAFIGLDMDKPYGEQDPWKKHVDSGFVGIDDMHRPTKLYLSLTPNQFYEVIDDVVLRESFLTREECLEFRRKRASLGIGNEQSEMVRNMLNKLTPAILKLIEMGFTWADIAV